jgi:hypothetical protein
MLTAFSHMKHPSDKVQAWRVSTDRARIASSSDQLQKCAWQWLKKKFGNDKRPDPSTESTGFAAEGTAISALGLALRRDAPRSIYRSETDGKPSVQVHSVRYALRPHQDGATVRDVVVEVVQRRRGYYDPELQKEVDGLDYDLPSDPSDKDQKYRPDFNFRGGCTLLIDGETGLVRYAISKDILSNARLSRRRKYESGDAMDGFGMTFTGVRQGPVREPFAMLHRGF